MTNGTRIPHTLRFIILLLRVVIGINFFYLGWTALFDHALGSTIQARSFGDLYAWLTAGASGASGTAGAAAGIGAGGSLQTLFAWAFLVIGACIAIGFVTRSMATAGIALTLASFLPTFSYSPLSAFEFANGEVVLMLCLLILIFANAGVYLGVDTFFHFHLSQPHKNIK